MSFSNKIAADNSAAMPLGGVSLLGGGILQNHGPNDVWLLADESSTPNVATVLSDGVKIAVDASIPLPLSFVLPTAFVACANGESADVRLIGQQA